MYLAQEPVASLMVASLRRGVLLGHYELGAYAIMANHVHVLLLPKVSPSRLLQSVKGATARQPRVAAPRATQNLPQLRSAAYFNAYARRDSPPRYPPAEFLIAPLRSRLRTNRCR